METEVAIEQKKLPKLKQQIALHLKMLS